MEKSQKRKLETDAENDVLSDMDMEFLEQIFPMDLLSSMKAIEKLELLRLILRISISNQFLS